MELNPVEVLCHLKALGYEDIEPHLLQQFMKDLKKLIKYEKQKSKVNENKNIELSSDSKYFLKEKNVILPKNHCTNDCCSKKKKDVFERLSRPNSKTKICSKAVSTVGVQTDLQYKHTKNSKYSQILKGKQMDPVLLYQYYQNEWQAHKVPGEKNHDQLRWKVRQMMNRKC